VVGAVVVAALVVTAIVLAGSGRSDEPATTTQPTLSAPAENPNVPATASATPSNGLSLAQARLAEMLDPLKLRGCRPSPVEGNFNADAALVCHVDDVGDVRVLHYFDADALQDEIKKRSGAINDVGSCTNGEDSVETWGRGSRRMGTLMCFSNASGSHLFWTIDKDLVAFEVNGPDGVQLVNWWRRFDPLA
jgi:hypothetical protein